VRPTTCCYWDQFKRIKQLEEEIQHVKTTKMIDKFAHKNIHGPGEKGHMSEEEIHQLFPFRFQFIHFPI
jgi:hypothetical protein